MNAYEPDTHPYIRLEASVFIRPLVAADLPRLEWHGQFVQYRNVFARQYQDQQRGKRHLLVATLNDYPIGRLFILKKQRDNPTTDEKRAYLHSFHMMEMFRGLGIGTALMEEADYYLKANGYHWVNISVARHNKDALRLYLRSGFRIFAEDNGDWTFTDHYGALRNVTEPSYLLEKPII